jgi:hypothetical protein
MQTNAQEQAALQEEWARMQGMGRRLQRGRMIATLAGTGISFLGFVAAAVVYLLWPLHKIPIVVLALPVAVGLGVGWTVRNKLWPKSQFG